MTWPLVKLGEVLTYCKRFIQNALTAVVVAFSSPMLRRSKRPKPDGF
ncbi:MAG: hypothetical protein U0746_20480 [Gemmataceae bacterium]